MLRPSADRSEDGKTEAETKILTSPSSSEALVSAEAGTCSRGGPSCGQPFWGKIGKNYVKSLGNGKMTKCGGNGGHILGKCERNGW